MRSTRSSYLVHRSQIISPNRWKVQQIRGRSGTVCDDRTIGTRLLVIAGAVICGCGSRLQDEENAGHNEMASQWNGVGQ